MKNLICAVTALAVSTAQADTIFGDVTDCNLSDCCSVHQTPGCDDPGCEAAVCTVYPSCCDDSWSSTCVFLAFDLCGACPPPGGSGTKADPYCSIQTAINNAVDTDEIVVAPGTYVETINFLGKAITLRSLDGRENTVIDGTDLGYGSVVVCESGEGPATVLDGFTITGGTGQIDSLGTYGGGLFIWISNPTIANCSFSGNHADFGGGIANFHGSATITNCAFEANSATDGGGGIYLGAGSDSPAIIACTFSENTALLGGGIYADGSSVTVRDCTFIGNVGSVPFSVGGGMLTNSGSPTVTNCRFDGNSAGSGGGMYNASNSPVITECMFSDNTASNGSPHSGYGGGMSNDHSSPTVTNCTFSGNTAMTGGGMFNFFSSSPTVTDCTFALNSATNGRALAFDTGGVCSCPSNLPMSNCILWDGGDEVWNNDESVITINNSNIQGGFAGIGNIDTDPLFVDPDHGDYRLQPGSPCIDAGDNTAVPKGVLRDLDGNPRFVADACAGASGPVVDMGAYEFQGTSCDLGDVMAMLAAWGHCDDCRTPQACPSDLDGDCSVGILDLLILLGSWTP